MPLLNVVHIIQERKKNPIKKMVKNSFLKIENIPKGGFLLEDDGKNPFKLSNTVLKNC
jgi:hypothetical protein